MSETSITVAPALEQDLEDIFQLLTPSVESEIILPRSREDLRENRENFLVARGAGALLGCVALRDYGDGLQEIRSLAVSPVCAGQGLGSQLVHQAIALAAQRQGKTVFTLTMRPNLFLRLGFKVVANDFFPQKVWADCRLCPKRERCNEVALCREII